EGIDWRPGIEVDRNVNGYSTVFFPGPPSGKTGFLKLVHESNIKNLNISIRELMKMVRNYGFGSAYLMNDEKPLEEVKN
ncbi:MAG: hypothetical protein ACXWV9_11345, partial [Flavisolibacter sp.]